jgi:AcrR family transcriptional regulator
VQDGTLCPGAQFDVLRKRAVPQPHIDGYCVAAMPAAPLPQGRGSLAPAATAFLQRARILDATARVVAERGYAGASVEEIRRRAGVSRRTFYTHFGGKEDAVVAAFDAAVAYVLPRLVEAFRGASDWAGAIDAAVAAYLALADCDGAWAAFCVVELPGAGRRAMARRDDALARLSEELGPSADLHGIIAALDVQLRTRLVGEGLSADAGFLRDAAARAAGVADALRAADWPTARAALARAVARGDGPVLYRALLALGEHRHEGGLPPPEDLEPLILGALPQASFFGLPVEALSRGEPGPWSVPSTTLRCLRHVCEHPDATASEIRAALGLAHLSTVTRQLNRLADAGLLERRRRGAPSRWRCSAAGTELAKLVASGAL